MDFEEERLRQVEQMLRHYLAQPKPAFIKRMEKGLLDEVFTGFQVKTERGVLIKRRANRLAADLAACVRRQNKWDSFGALVTEVLAHH